MSESDMTNRIMRALYAAGFIEMGSAEDDPEAAADLFKYLTLEGVDLTIRDAKLDKVPSYGV